jgi:hypothetical protein
MLGWSVGAVRSLTATGPATVRNQIEIDTDVAEGRR